MGLMSGMGAGAGLWRPLRLLLLPPLRRLAARLLCVRLWPRRPGNPPCCLHICHEQPDSHVCDGHLAGRMQTPALKSWGAVAVGWARGFPESGGPWDAPKSQMP